MPNSLGISIIATKVRISSLQREQLKSMQFLSHQDLTRWRRCNSFWAVQSSSSHSSTNMRRRLQHCLRWRTEISTGIKLTGQKIINRCLMSLRGIYYTRSLYIIRTTVFRGSCTSMHLMWQRGCSYSSRYGWHSTSHFVCIKKVYCICYQVVYNWKGSILNVLRMHEAAILHICQAVYNVDRS